jgi:PIN domain
MPATQSRAPWKLLSTTATKRASERLPQRRASRSRTTALWQSTRVLVTPRPGVNRKHLRDTLRSVHTDVANLQGGGPHGAYKRLLAYLEWTSNAARSLANLISSDDLDELVLTKRYERLLSGVGNMTSDEVEVQRVVNGLVSTELNERTAAFGAAVAAVEEQISRWSRLGEFVMPDTSFYITHPDKLKETDFAAVVETRGAPIHVLVPIVVVDELDRLKESKDRHVRWRAGHTLGVLDELFTSPAGQPCLRIGDFSALQTGGIPRGEITMELVFDPPGHVRLPINDDEIIDRAMAVEPLAARPVTLLTYDTGQSMRARAAGIPAKKLTKPIGEEPAP